MRSSGVCRASEHHDSKVVQVGVASAAPPQPRRCVEDSAGVVHIASKTTVAGGAWRPLAPVTTVVMHARMAEVEPRPTHDGPAGIGYPRAPVGGPRMRPRWSWHCRLVAEMGRDGGGERDTDEQSGDETGDGSGEGDRTFWQWCSHLVLISMNLTADGQRCVLHEIPARSRFKFGGTSTEKSAALVSGDDDEGEPIERTESGRIECRAMCGGGVGESAQCSPRRCSQD
jgi:hypothetical protein